MCSAILAGPESGIQNIGFIDVTDQPYPELVAAARLTHSRLLEIHRGTMPPTGRKARASETHNP